MKKSLKNLERRQFLNKFDAISSVGTRPRKGWVHTTRKALGMTMSQLAKRLGVQQSRVAEIEKTEVQDQLTLKTLKATAQAMGCRLEYVFIPEQSLEGLLRKRALKIARARVDYISHHMALEHQELSSEEKESQIKQLAEELLQKPQKLWEE